jgi:hypothetical protein
MGRLVGIFLHPVSDQSKLGMSSEDYNGLCLVVRDRQMPSDLSELRSSRAPLDL